MYNYTLDELQEWYGRKNKDVSISAKSLVLEKLNEKYRAIAEEAIDFVKKSYSEQPTPLSIRQVHYHLVHQLIGTYTNTIKDYNILIKLILQARIAGLIPWHMISETESLVSYNPPTGMNPKEAIKKALEEAAKQPGIDPWDAMNKCVVVFTEKRELQPQLELITNKYYVRLISLRGYGAWSRLYKEALGYKDFTKIMMSKETMSAEEEQTIGSFLELVNTVGKLRIPVYKGSKENIVGVAHVKDAAKPENQNMHVKDIMHTTFTINKDGNIEEDRKGYTLYAYFVTDHDPSGLDINRLYASILKNFWNVKCIDCRVMLKKDQVDAGNLPPAPTKVKDPRSKWYMGKFGTNCWEVDALGREKMQKTLEDEIRKLIDWKIWDEVEKMNKENAERTRELAKDSKKLTEMMKDIMKDMK